MLQRAASNAYSWWWASHIRTKQSKWLEQNLQDMEEKVKATLNLLQDDGDSFAKRAEMYYRKRPELINFVDETFRAYKSLAERYNHISGELQNANTTIATVFPEQVQFAMEDDDEDGCSPRVPRQTYDPTKLVKEPPEPPKPNIPKVPKIPKKDVKGLLTLPTKRVQAKSTTSTPTAVTNSRITKTEALELIDKLQKGILALQTEKEFVKGSYESSLAKYCEIEKRIGEMQDEVCGLQDEFSVNTFIEDDEARSLMATTALKSCQESLVQLLEKQEKSAEESRVEHQRIKEAKEKFENLKRRFLPNQTDQPKMPEKEGSTAADSSLKSLEEEVEISKQERVELESIREKIKEHFETDADSSLTVTELAERIDELVTKVISLESAVSSQTALMKRLRSETTELHTNLHQLEEDKSTLIKDSNVLTEKLRKLEVGLNGVQDLNKNIEDQNNNLQTHFTEARCNLDHLAEKLQNVKQHEEDDEEEEEEEDKEVETTTTDSFQTEVIIPLDVISSLNVESHNQLVEVQNMLTLNDNSVKTEAGITEKEKVGSVSHDVNDQENSHRRFTGQVDLDVLSKKLIEPNELNAAENSSQTGDSDVDVESREEENNQDLPIDWQKLLLNGLEDREKILLTEYTSILRNYKDAKRKLTEVEKKNREGLFERLVQIRELKNANDSKDEEIRSLRQKLSVLQTSFEGNVDTLVADSEGSQNNRSHDGAEEGSTSRYSVNSANQADRNVEATTRPEESAKIKTAEEQEESEMILADEPHIVSTMEEKFRKEIDELLEENLEFWLRFSTSFHQIQKFQTSIHDLQTEISKLKEKKKQEGNSSSSSHGFRALKSDARPIYKHLGEIQTELTVWLEKSAVLKEELQCRFSSLCDIQEEISKVLKMPSNTNAIADSELTRVQAAKFQGEVLNMKQENNKVADELQAGLDHVNSLHLEIEKTLSKLNDDYKLSGSSKSQSGKHGPAGKPRIPLRSFLFGSRPNKKKPSIFLCINPALHKHHHSNDLADGLPI